MIGAIDFDRLYVIIAFGVIHKRSTSKILIHIFKYSRVENLISADSSFFCS